MKNAIQQAFDNGADNWDMCSDEEIERIILEWLSDPSNWGEVGEAMAHDGIILADILTAAFNSKIEGARTAAVGACVMDIVRRRVRSEAKHIFDELLWEKEGV